MEKDDGSANGIDVNDGPANGYVVNELLCFVKNKIDILPQPSIVQLCVGAYSDQEIEHAKKLFFDMSADESTCRHRRRQGPDKNRWNVEDILQLMREKGPDVPCFVALDLNKLPPITFDSIDVTVLLNHIQKTQAEVKQLKDAVTKSTENTNDLRESVSKVHHRVARVERQIHDPLNTGALPMEAPPSVNNVEATLTTPENSWAAKAMAGIARPVFNSESQQTTRKATPKSVANRIRTKPKGITGKSVPDETSQDGMLRAVKPRQRLRYANVFATRFEPTVTKLQVETYLKKHLPEKASITDLVVEQLKTKHESYCSFHITARCNEPSVFMDENLWPKDVFVRWWRKERKPNITGPTATTGQDDESDNEEEVTTPKVAENAENDGIAYDAEVPDDTTLVKDTHT